MVQRAGLVIHFLQDRLLQLSELTAIFVLNFPETRCKSRPYCSKHGIRLFGETHGGRRDAEQHAAVHGAGVVVCEPRQDAFLAIDMVTWKLDGMLEGSVADGALFVRRNP